MDILPGWMAAMWTIYTGLWDSLTTISGGTVWDWDWTGTSQALGMMFRVRTIRGRTAFVRRLCEKPFEIIGSSFIFEINRFIVHISNL